MEGTTFIPQGAVCLRIGSLLPLRGMKPRYFQLYIYDTDWIDIRIAENENLEWDVVQNWRHILDWYIPFVHQFRQLAQWQGLSFCRLIIRQQSSSLRQYTLSTALQVPAILVDCDVFAIVNGGDIIVETIGGHLIHVQDVDGYYDPLQYLLFLPCGSYSWDVNSHSNNRRRVTCRRIHVAGKYSVLIRIFVHML